MKPRSLAAMLIRATILALLLFCPACTSSTNQQAAALYKTHCQGCHGADGQGLRKLYPALSESALLNERLRELPCLIRRGGGGKDMTGGDRTNWRMPPFPGLTNDEIRQLCLLLQQRWGGRRFEITAEQVDRWLLSCI